MIRQLPDADLIISLPGAARPGRALFTMMKPQ